MRSFRLIRVAFLLFLIVFFEREYPYAPFTWMLLALLSVRLKLPFLLILLITLFADIAFAMPLGTSVIVHAGFVASVSLAPKKMGWRTLYFVLIGSLLGILYGSLGQVITVQLIFISALLCTIFYSVGSRMAAIAEIGHVQN